MKKIATIFKRNPDKMSEILPEINPECEWVFKGEGIATRKYDGTCCKCSKHGPGWEFFKRREVKKNKPLPANFVLEQEDEITGKRVGWVPVDRYVPEDKYHRSAFMRTFIPEGTYELCGPKINGNPEGFEEHVLVSHDTAEKLVDVPRTYEGLKEYLADKDIEGIVFRRATGQMAKIKKKDFGLKRK